MHPAKAVRNEPTQRQYVDHDRKPSSRRDSARSHSPVAEERPSKQQRLDNGAADLLDEAAEIARRRALRAEILNKYKRAPVDVPASPATPLSPMSPAAATPDAFVLEKETAPQQARTTHFASAADYDPNADRVAEDAAHAETRIQQAVAATADTVPEVEEDDMFADPAPVVPTSTERTVVTQARKMDPGMHETWADAEGYYHVMLGELLHDRFAVTSILGRGVFSAVVGALDQQEKNAPVAIKVIRNNPVMRKAGAQEIALLQLLNKADPDDRKHVVRLKTTFEHRDHLCLVFEHLALNLREILRKFGRDVGIQIRAVRAYGGQLFLALSHLERHKVVHGDLKPDNILVSESRTVLKLCDLGSATFHQPDEKRQFDEATAYLASRFYRAPEVILGAGVDYGVDVWAAGCTLFEMYTGQILFPGRSNSMMLKLMMQLKGKMPAKVVRRGKFGFRHFDDALGFLSQETDAVTGDAVTRRLEVAAKPVWDLKRRVLLPGHKRPDLGESTMPEQQQLQVSLMTAAQQTLPVEERTLVLQLISLLERCLELDPARRLTAAEALRHPFLSLRGGH